MKRPGGFDQSSQQPSPKPRRVKAETPQPAPVPDVVPELPSADRAPVEAAPAELAQPEEPRSEVVRAETDRGVASRFPFTRKSHADPLKAAERKVREAERQHKRSKRRETKRFTQAIRRTRRRVLIAVSAVCLLVIFVIVGVFTPLMAVRDVQVEGSQSINVDDVTAALQKFEGTPLALVDENEVLRSLESFPLIQRFAVERIPPHTLLVRIEERVPAIALESDGVFRQYDAAGVLVAETAERPEGVPLGEGSLRTTSSPAFQAASRIVRDVPADLRSQMVSVKATSNQDVTFMLSNGIEVFWGSADETKRKALVLQTMLTSLEGRAVSHIDVSSTSAPIFR